MAQIPTEEAAMPYEPDEDREPASAIAAVKEHNERRLLSIDGVEGVGIGLNEIGDEAIVIYLRDGASQERVPSELDGFPVRCEVTGVIEAY